MKHINQSEYPDISVGCLWQKMFKAQQCFNNNNNNINNVLSKALPRSVSSL